MECRVPSHLKCKNKKKSNFIPHSYQNHVIIMEDTCKLSDKRYKSRRFVSYFSVSSFSVQLSKAQSRPCKIRLISFFFVFPWECVRLYLLQYVYIFFLISLVVSIQSLGYCYYQRPKIIWKVFFCNFLVAWNCVSITSIYLKWNFFHGKLMLYF